MALTFDDTDQADIDTAIVEGGKIWSNACLDRLKRKIKEHFTDAPHSKCCYCARLLVGEFNMVIDIEHILPQHHYPDERFVIQNLNVACKRCNMEIKKGDLSFIVNAQAMGTGYYESRHYHFIHPNLDDYSTHIVLTTIRIADLILNKYVLKNNGKAKFTYDYFKLKELEIDTLNRAQGLQETPVLDRKLSDGLRRSLEALIHKI